MAKHILNELADIIHARRSEDADNSYTRQLLAEGLERCAKKLGEEAVETVIAGIAQTDEELAAEAADLIYHLLVLLEARDVPWENVLDVLRKRMGTSGLLEKASRTG